MRTLRMACLGAMVALAVPGLADEGGSEKNSNSVLCPVMGEPASFFISAESEEGPVYMCCKRCIRAFKKDPARFADKVTAQREALAKLPKTQVTCPVSGDAVDPEVSTGEGANKVQFCCGNCKGAYEKEPAKYKARLAASYTYQTICPVMDEPINPEVSQELPTGETLYYCCKGCRKRMIKDPQKYNEKLVSQGIHINWERVLKKLGE